MNKPIRVLPTDSLASTLRDAMGLKAGQKIALPQFDPRLIDLSERMQTQVQECARAFYPLKEQITQLQRSIVLPPFHLTAPAIAKVSEINFAAISEIQDSPASRYLRSPEGQAAMAAKQKEVDAYQDMHRILSKYPQCKDDLYHEAIRAGRLILPPPVSVKTWRDVAAECPEWNAGGPLKYPFVRETVEVMIENHLSAKAAAEIIVSMHDYSPKGRTHKKGTVVGSHFDGAVENLSRPARKIFKWLQEKGFFPNYS